MAERRGDSPGQTRVQRAVNALLPMLLLLLLCTVAFQKARHISANADWPYLTDAFRDIGMAQTILDGRYPEDSVLLGHTLWYNPLTGALVALGSHLSGLPAHTVDARLGPYINLLVPVSFFLLCAALFGGWAALAATAFMILGNTRIEPIWLGVTYTPWLFAPHLAQALFFFTLYFYVRAQCSGRYRSHTATGVLWGLTFMTHTAPAVIFGCIVLMCTAWRFFAGASAAMRRQLVWKTAVAAAVAFTVSIPYHYSILWNYHFHVLNPWPSIYTESVLQIANMEKTLWQACSLPTGIAVLGALALVLKREHRRSRLFILPWLIILLLFLMQSFLWQYAPFRFPIPQLFPVHHFAVSLNGLRSLLFGCGAVLVCRGLFSLGNTLLARFNRRGISPGWHESVVGIFLFVLLAAAYTPAYRSWIEFTGRPAERWPFASMQADAVRCYEWTMQHCRPDDVFLSDENLALLVLESAARKTVCPMLFYGSPYADVLQRLLDREAMFDAFRSKDEDRFRELARKRGVGFVMVQGREKVLLDASGFTGFQAVFESGPITILRYTPAG